jgi:hypothetical protein
MPRMLKDFAVELSNKFKKLISENQDEQTYQTFLEQNTQLLPREFVRNHGIHFNLVLRKLPFGADYKADFFYLSKSSAEWNCVFIEIEKPSSKFFKDKTNEFHGDFNQALQQINSWKAWFKNNGNRSGFIDGIINIIRTPLEENPCHMKYVLVHGRRAEYEGNALRTNLISSQGSEDFKIVSFDSLLEDLESKHDLYVGIRKNEYIEIISDAFVGESLFTWTRPEQIMVSPELIKNALAAKDSWCSISTVNGEMALTAILPQLRLRPTA